MAKNKNKNKKVDWEKNSAKFAHDIDSIMFLLYDLKDDAFKGEITHNELIERLFDVCSKMNTACETFEESRWED
jgi:hypothetical protein